MAEFRDEVGKMISSKEFLIIRRILRKLTKEEIWELFKYLLVLQDNGESRGLPASSEETDS